MCLTAIAGGMMIAASYSLVCEGMSFRDETTLGILATIQKLGKSYKLRSVSIDK